MLIILIFTLGNSSDAFLILRAKSLGIPISLIPVLWLVLHFSKTSFNISGGKLSDKIGRSKTLFAGWLVYALVYLGFGLVNSAWLIWVLFIIYGLYFGLNEGSERALIADLVPQEKLGTAYGIYNFNIGIMALPASVLTGLIWQKIGFFWAFALDAALAGSAAIMVLLLVKK
jgi:MFS family permease